MPIPSETKGAADFRPIDAVVVLGAALKAPGVPGPALVRRLDHGVTVMAETEARYLVVSGGVVGPPPAEAEVMRQRARARGVPNARIIVEDRARNTFENAVFTAQIARQNGWRRLALVTDPVHMRRALYLFRRLGIAVVAKPVPTGQTGNWWKRQRGHLRESLALAWSATLFAAGRHKAVVEAVRRR